MQTLTAAQAALLQRVLRNGGRVSACMGRAAPGRVNKIAASNLIDAGLLAIGEGQHPRGRSFRHDVDLVVTAAGCVALRRFEDAQAWRELVAQGLHL